MDRTSSRQHPRPHPPRPILDARAHTKASSPTAVHQRVVPLVTPFELEPDLGRARASALLAALLSPERATSQGFGKRPVLTVLGLLAAMIFGRQLLARK